MARASAAGHRLSMAMRHTGSSMRTLGKASASRRAAVIFFPISQAIGVAYVIYGCVAFGAFPMGLVAAIALGVACIPVDLYLFGALADAEKSDLVEERARILDEQLEAQQAYRARLEEEVRSARQIRASILEELDRVAASLGEEEAEGAANGLAKAVEISDRAFVRVCDNDVVAALMSLKLRTADEAGVRLDAQLKVPCAVEGIEDMELCTVFSNLLDNAIAAALKAPEDRRYVKVRAGLSGWGFFAVEVENGCSDDEGAPAIGGSAESRVRDGGLPGPQVRGGDPLREHGWGIQIVRTVAERHGGVVDMSCGGGLCSVKVILQTRGRS